MQQQVESGVSVRQFCAAEELSEHSVYTWRKQLAVPRESDSHCSVAKAPARGRRGVFVPGRLLESGPAREIIHPLGDRIQLTGDVNPIALRHMIETLDARGRR